MSTFSVLDAARESPRGLAVVDRDRQLDFGELGERVRQRMIGLAPLGEATRAVPAARLVAFRASETLATLELILALLELGQAFLPLHARLTPREAELLLERLPVAWLVEPGLDGAPRLVAREGRGANEREQRLFEQTPQLAALATSGSSGEPNVVLSSRRAFFEAARASAANLGWQPQDRWLLSLPLAHIGGLSVVTRCLLARRPVLLPDPARDAGLGERLAQTLLELQPSLLSLVPTQLSALLALQPGFELPRSVRAILTGGAAASPALLSACAERGWPVLTSYGSTEACSQVATQRPGTTNRGELGVGHPLPGVEVRLRGGAIQLRGPTLFSGYLVGPLEPFDAEGWFTTGDLGRFDEQGQLHVLGRSDHVIISGGENVTPGEVEAVLEACPGVLEACVFAVPDPHWGQLVAAALRVRDLDSETILAGAERNAERLLAVFKRPRRYVLATAFVYGPTGKLDRRGTAEALRGQLRPAQK